MKTVMRSFTMLALGILFSFAVTVGQSFASGLTTHPAITYTALGTATSPTYYPNNRACVVAVFVKAEDAGTFKVQRLDRAGNWNDLMTATAAGANTEDQHIFPYSLNAIRVSYTNTDNSAGSFRVEYQEGCI